MKTLEQQVSDSKKNKKVGLMTHVVAGFPNIKESQKMILAMAQMGVDFIEVQIPFSDPLADGATISEANDCAVKNNTTVKDVFKLVKKISNKISVPLLCMTYYNLVHFYGTERFMIDAKEAGFVGLIVPDMPYDEDPFENFSSLALKSDLATIRVVSPTSTLERIKQNCKLSQGFIYTTSVSGTTGTRTIIQKQTNQFLKKMRTTTSLPLALGFGISTPEQVESLVGKTDIVVVGSAVIKKRQEEGYQQSLQFVQSLVSATTF